MLRSLFWLVCFAAAAAAQAQQGDALCAKCHMQARTQPLTQMGMALQARGDSPVLKAHSRLTFQKDIFEYTVDTRNGITTYSVTDGTHSVSFPIDWSFGVHNQTWVYERDGLFYETLVSFYSSISGLAITTGDEAIVPKNVEEAAGRELYQGGEARECFGCHSTNSSTVSSFGEAKLDLAALHPGVDCQQCHQGTEKHLVETISGKFNSIPASLSELNTEDMSDFCGRCHRTWDKVVRSRWHGEFDVRFQPYRLANSQCYDGTDPRIGCTACHDVHKPLVRDAAFYDAKCLACHSVSARPAVNANHERAKACLVAKSDCTSCHMPKVGIPGGPLVYTDHQIRIVRAGEPYPN